MAELKRKHEVTIVNFVFFVHEDSPDMQHCQVDISDWQRVLKTKEYEIAGKDPDYACLPIRDVRTIPYVINSAKRFPCA